MSTARCRSGKVRYPHQKAANNKLTELIRYRAIHGPLDGMELRSYQCTMCHGWHLTSMKVS